MIRTESPVMSANSVKRNMNWVRRPLHSGPLSALIIKFEPIEERDERSKTSVG